MAQGERPHGATLLHGWLAAPSCCSLPHLLGLALLVALLLWLGPAARRFARVARGLATVPSAPGGNWLIGHVLPLITCTLRGKGAWDMMEEWLAGRPIVKFRILGTHGVAVSQPAALKRIFQTNQRAYEKDLALSYQPFLPILGTGLVTSDGDLWQKQRVLIGPALRVEILDDIIPIAKRAVDRLSAKLEGVRGSAAVVDLEQEFRLLTLQVIGDAVLSMEPEECDRVRARCGVQPGRPAECAAPLGLHAQGPCAPRPAGVPCTVPASHGGGQQARAPPVPHVPAAPARVVALPQPHGGPQRVPRQLLQVRAWVRASQARAELQSHAHKACLHAAG